MRRLAATIAVSMVSAAALAAASPHDARAADIVEGKPLDRVVATFTAPPALPTAAIVAWGDGETSEGTLEDRADGGRDVRGIHTYERQGTYTVKVTDKADADNYRSMSLTVKDAPIAVSGRSFATAAAAGG